MTVKVTYIGHSAVYIEGSQNIIIDPFINGNPASNAKPSDFKPDIILLTHDHEDHFGDTEYFLKKGTIFAGIHELAVRFSESGYKAEGMNIGGTIDIKGIKINMTHALHTCYTGHPVGFVVEIDGKSIYHAGDTGLSMDMKLLGDFFNIDLAFLPIGDRYTMGAASAAKAAEWIKAKKVVPFHYDTWPLIKGNIKEFQKLTGNKALILNPGDSTEL